VGSDRTNRLIVIAVNSLTNQRMNPTSDESEEQIKKNVEDRIREAILAIDPDAQVTVSVDMKTGKVVVEGADTDLVNRAIDSIPSSE